MPGGLRELGPWSASVFMRYFGPRPLVEDDSQRSTASTIFNAHVAYRFEKLARLTFEVFNLLDTRVDDIAYYYASRLRGEPAGGLPDIHSHPAEKRSFRLTVAFEF